MSKTYLEIEVTDPMVWKAGARAMKMGHIKNSITMGKANLEAFVAEEALSHHLKQKIEDTYDYDLFWAPEGEVFTADIKTKRRTKLPSPYFDCHIADTSLHQDCDTYIFASVIKEDEWFRVWALGWLTKDEFFERARRVRKGDKDGPFVEHVDGYKCKVADLRPMP